MEYAATLGMSTDAGKAYVGKTLELRYRLPRLWDHVMTGRLPVWRAMRVAEHTCCLPAAAAADVDQALAPAAGTCSWSQVDRLVEEALARHDPDQAEARRRRAADGRRFDVETDLVDTAGTVQIAGPSDLADALDLEAAVSRTATQLAELGSTESLDVRRSMAVGEIARQQLALDLDTGEIQPWPRPERGAQRPPHRSRHPRCRRQRRPLRQHPHPHPARPSTRLVPDRGPDHHRPDQGPHRPPPRRGLRDPRPDQAPSRAAQPHLRLPPLHPPRRNLRPRPHRPLGTRRHRAARPAHTTSHPSADDTTARRPTAAGATAASTPPATSGPPRTATASSATTTAPTPRPHPTPHPANPDHLGLTPDGGHRVRRLVPRGGGASRRLRG